MRLLAHLLMKLFVLIVQSSVSYLFEMTITSSLPVVIGSFVGLIRCLDGTRVSVVKFSHPRSGTATDPSIYLHILSQQLENGQIWLDFGANNLGFGTNNIPLREDFRLSVLLVNLIRNSHFSQP